MRIGELSRRVGVSRELLRAWERRYGLLRPSRSSGGMRLYSAEDERRIRAVQQNMARGLTAAEAARLAKGSDAREPGDDSRPGELHEVARSLREALQRFDAPDDRGSPMRERGLGGLALETALPALGLDAANQDLGADHVLRDVVTPQLRRLGWVSTEAGMAGAFLFGLALGRLLAGRHREARDRVEEGRTSPPSEAPSASGSRRPDPRARLDQEPRPPNGP